MAKYYDILYGKNSLLVLWGVIVSDDTVEVEYGALGDYLPKTIELFSTATQQIVPIATIELKEFSGIADNGNGGKTNLTFSILKD